MSLKKNRLDLEHATIMQERGVYLATMIGYPITVINLIITFGLYLEPWFPVLLAVLMVPLTLFYMLFDDRTMRVRVKQAEIEALIKELEGPLEPPS